MPDVRLPEVVASQDIQASAPRLIEVDDDADRLLEEFMARGWGDGLPMIAPTRERVEAMLEGMGLAGDAIVGRVAPLYRPATAEAVAVNAVLAGCRPDYGPVVVAAVRACVESSFNLFTVQSTTNACTPYILVNGPVREACGINGAWNALGQGWRANATIGRALRLILVNVGGAVPETVDKATVGHPGKFSFCSAENEEASPWASYACAEAGFSDPAQSVVSAFAITSILNIVDWSEHGEEILGTIAGSIRQTGSNDYLSGGSPLLLLCPEHAHVLAREGFDRRRVQQELWQRSLIALDEFPPKTQEMISTRRGGEASVGTDAMVPIAVVPEELHIAVVGGGSVHSAFLATVGVSRAVSIAVQ